MICSIQLNKKSDFLLFTGMVFDEAKQLCNWPRDVPPPCGTLKPPKPTVTAWKCLISYFLHKNFIPEILSFPFPFVSSLLYDNVHPVVQHSFETCDYKDPQHNSLKEISHLDRKHTHKYVPKWSFWFMLNMLKVFLIARQWIINIWQKYFRILDIFF